MLWDWGLDRSHRDLFPSWVIATPEYVVSTDRNRGLLRISRSLLVFVLCSKVQQRILGSSNQPFTILYSVYYVVECLHTKDESFGYVCSTLYMTAPQYRPDTANHSSRQRHPAGPLSLFPRPIRSGNFPTQMK